MQRPCRFVLYLYLSCHRITEGYSGSDLTALARDAALMSIRGINSNFNSTKHSAYVSNFATRNYAIICK